MTDAVPLHVIFGAGQIGALLAAMLVERGLRVRVVRESEGPVPTGVELLRGDAGDLEFCRGAAGGAAAVYHCMNPVYSKKVWAELVPRFADNLIDASGKAGARLVVLDNLYPYAPPSGGRPLDEESPFGPPSKKGAIRAEATARYLAADKERRAHIVIGRASDFYGPGAELTNFGPSFWKPVLRGKAGDLLIKPDAVHTYHYVHDVARGLAELGTAAGDDLHGKTFMLPCPPAESASTLIARFGEVLGRPITVRVMPRALLGVLGVFMPIMGEIKEMLYQWDQPLIVSDARFRARFPGVEPTPLLEAAKATVAWAQSKYA